MRCIIIAMENKHWCGHWHTIPTITPFRVLHTYIEFLVDIWPVFSSGSYRRTTLLHPYINCKSIFCLFIWFVRKKPCAMLWIKGKKQPIPCGSHIQQYIYAEKLPQGMRYQTSTIYNIPTKTVRNFLYIDSTIHYRCTFCCYMFVQINIVGDIICLHRKCGGWPFTQIKLIHDQTIETFRNVYISRLI